MLMSAFVCTAECAAGFGRQGNNCQKCPAGKYQPGYLGNDAAVSPTNNGFGDGSTCITCEKTRSVYISSKGKEFEYESDGTTYREGATGREECVPKTAQLGIDIGTKFFEDNSLLPVVSDFTPTATTPFGPDACLTAACQPGQCCFVQFDYAWRSNAGSEGTKTCRAITMTVNTVANSYATADLLFYKMLPSDAIAAASVNKTGKVEAKAMSSGLYARCDLPSTWAAAGTYGSNAIGRRIDGTGAACSTGCPLPASTAADLADCKKKCDMLSVCWGFTMKGGQCQLRGGYDEMDVRSFFRNPDPSAGHNW
jgi:hypothetical protein